MELVYQLHMLISSQDKSPSEPRPASHYPIISPVMPLSSEMSLILVWKGKLSSASHTGLIFNPTGSNPSFSLIIIIGGGCNVAAGGGRHGF